MGRQSNFAILLLIACWCVCPFSFLVHHDTLGNHLTIMSNPRSKSSTGYRNIALALLAVVFIQATVIVQLYFARAPYTSTSSSSSLTTDTNHGSDENLLKNPEPMKEDTQMKPHCGTMGIIRSGEDNAAPLGISNVDARLVHPTEGLMLDGEMISNGPVPAVAVRYKLESDFLYNDASEAEEWLVASVNMEYIKMLLLTIKKNNNGQLLVYTAAAGYVNIHSLHSFGNFVNIEGITTADLTSAVIRNAWSKKADQELHGYQVVTFNYCVCSVIDSKLPMTKFDSLPIPLSVKDASRLVITDSYSRIGGSQITNGPIRCKAFRSTNIVATNQIAIWLIAAVNDDYIKMVEITISHSDADAQSLSVHASNSGYSVYREFGTHDTDGLTSRVVNAAWNKMIPNQYDVFSLSFYSSDMGTELDSRSD